MLRLSNEFGKTKQGAIEKNQHPAGVGQQFVDMDPSWKLKDYRTGVPSILFTGMVCRGWVMG